MNLLQQVENCSAYLLKRTEGFVSEIGIILGTGLGGLLKEIAIDFEIPYDEIPHFVEATVESHHGKLIFGTLSGKKVICMSGRFHFYEGHSMVQITFPVRVMKNMGIEKLLISNASGGLNADYKESDLMIINDHIGLFLPDNPLRGENIMGDRFPDMSEPYDKNMIALAEEIIQISSIKRVQNGVYVAVSGPNLETRAEYGLLKNLGADTVGMSTVPEVLVAVQMKLPVFAISVITDMCIPETLKKASIQNILAAAHKAEPTMSFLFKEMLLRM